MPQTTDNPNSKDLVAGYVLNDLNAEESVRLHEALEEDPALHREVQSFQEAFALIPYGSPVEAPAASLKNKILEAASRTGSAESAAHPVSPIATSPIATNVVPIQSAARDRSWRRHLPAVSTAIAAVAVAALGFNQIQLNKQQQQTVAIQQQLESTTSELTRLQAEVRNSQAIAALLSDPTTQAYPMAGEKSNARVLVRPGDREVAIVSQGLPALPEGKIYRFWAVTQASATPLYCGQFRPDSSGNSQWSPTDTTCLENPLEMMITLESPNDPTTLPGPVVMESVV
jgi:anti-sigma-K factor RskA